MLTELKNKAKELGLDLFGTADISRALGKGLEAFPYAVSIGVRLLNGALIGVENGPTHTYFHHYRTVNTFIDQCALTLAFMLKRSGYDAVCVPASQTVDSAGIAGLFPHKTAAVLSGLGFIGKSCLFVSEAFGPRVRLCTILTDCPLPAGEVMAPRCGDCGLCVRACPCGALYGAEWREGMERGDMMDASLCSRLMKQKYRDIGRGAVCGICMAVCPFGKSEHM
jgi:epoxyqueuosine reductase